MDPENSDIWACTCFPDAEGGGPNYTCVWALQDPAFNPSTWINIASSMYLDVVGPSMKDGARVDQWTYTGGNNQFWAMNESSCGCPGFLNGVSSYSGRCLAVNGGSTTQGASILQWACNGHPDQTWIWAWTGSYTSSGWPVWNILNTNSGMCLGIQGGSLQRGAYAIQWSGNGNPDQKWY